MSRIIQKQAKANTATVVAQPLVRSQLMAACALTALLQGCANSGLTTSSWYPVLGDVDTGEVRHTANTTAAAPKAPKPALTNAAEMQKPATNVAKAPGTSAGQPAMPPKSTLASTTQQATAEAVDLAQTAANKVVEPVSKVTAKPADQVLKTAETHTPTSAKPKPVNSVVQNEGEAVGPISIVLPTLAPSYEMIRKGSDSKPQERPVVAAKPVKSPAVEVVKIEAPAPVVAQIAPPTPAPAPEVRQNEVLVAETPSLEKPLVAPTQDEPKERLIATVPAPEPKSDAIQVATTQVVQVEEIERLPATAAGIAPVEVLSSDEILRPGNIPANYVLRDLGMWKLQKNWDGNHPNDCRLSSATIQVNGNDFTSQIWFSLENGRFLINSSAPIAADSSGVGVKIDNGTLIGLKRISDAWRAVVDQNLVEKLKSAKTVDLYLKLGPDSQKITRSTIDVSELRSGLASLKSCS